MTADTLELRRQVLLARASLQRFALRGDIGSLRASLQPAAWRQPVAIATGALRLLPLALRLWAVLGRR
jgi:hypothetical protein